MTDKNQPDFFVLDLADVAVKDDLASMEHPFFSLATKADHRHLVYETQSARLEITPSGRGLPTIFDKDVLIFCISKLMHAKNNGEKISNKVRFNAYEMLRATGRKTGGVEYRRLGDAFLRLTGTVFKTDVKTGGKRETRFFSMLDSGSGFVFKDDERMRLDFCEVVLSEWVMRSIEANEVVTISNDYFQLRKPLERRIYELARKHCGNQKQWKIGLSNLKTKTGSNSPLKLFRHKIRKLIEQDHIPFYRFELDENDNVVFRPRKPATEYRDAIKLPQWAEDKARDILVKKNLSYQWYLEEWLDFAAAETAKGNPPKDAGAAFVAYCQKLKGQR